MKFLKMKNIHLVLLLLLWIWLRMNKLVFRRKMLKIFLYFQIIRDKRCPGFNINKAKYSKYFNNNRNNSNVITPKLWIPCCRKNISSTARKYTQFVTLEHWKSYNDNEVNIERLESGDQLVPRVSTSQLNIKCL